MVPLVFVGLFFLWPLVALGRRALDDAHGLTLLGAWQRTDGLHLALVTVGQAAASALLALVVAAPIVWLIARVRIPAAGVVRALVTVPFVLPTVVAALAVRAALTGPLAFLGITGGLWAILLAHVFLNVAVIVRVVAAAWERIDQRGVDVARSLGSSPLRAFVDVVVPRLAPAIAAALALVFLFCSTSYGVIVVLGEGQFHTLETEVYQWSIGYFRIPEAAALSLLQLLVVAAALIVTRLLGRSVPADSSTVVAKLPLRGTVAIAAAAVACWLAMWLVLPIGMLVLRSLRPSSDGPWTLAGYRGLGVMQYGQTPIQALWYSATGAVAAMLIALLVGGSAALAVARSSGTLAKVAGVLSVAPLGVSAVTLGFGYLLIIRNLPREITESPLVIPSVQALLAIPLVIGVLVPALRAVPPRLRDAAAALGAGPVRVLRTVDLPLISRSLGVAAGFAFVMAIGEFGATTFLIGPDTTTLPVLIGNLLGRPGGDALATAHAAAVVLTVTVGAVVAAIELLRPADHRSHALRGDG